MGYQIVHLGRHPPPKDLLGKTFYAVGSVLRAAGVALDSLGVIVQGPTASKEQRKFVLGLGAWELRGAFAGAGRESAIWAPPDPQSSQRQDEDASFSSWGRGMPRGLSWGSKLSGSEQAQRWTMCRHWCHHCTQRYSSFCLFTPV